MSGNVVYSSYSCTSDYSVAAFNIQIFGVAKMERELPRTLLPQIIGQYDLVGIQEIRDISGTAIEDLNRSLPRHAYVISPRLGRTQTKEQYAVFYDPMVVTVINHTVYPDSDDRFEREPMIVYLKMSKPVFDDTEGIDDRDDSAADIRYTGMYPDDLDKVLSFSYIVVHVKPSDAPNEIKHLGDVIRYAQELYGDDDFILAGDLNADCSYYDVNLDHLSEYTWAIPHKMDTTVSRRICTYDRIITNMDYCLAGVFNFEHEFLLTHEETKTISDHFPVFITI